MQRLWILFVIIAFIIVNTLMFSFEEIFRSYLPEIMNGVNLRYTQAAILAFEAIFIIILFHRTYIHSLHRMAREISAFLAGQQNDGLTIPRYNPDLEFLAKFFNQTLSILKRFKDELKNGKTLRSEVDLAAELQQHTLSKDLAIPPGLEIICNSKPAGTVGGDSFDVIAGRDEKQFYMYLGDVTGHGVASGFVMMMVNALIVAFSQSLTSSSQILAQTNKIVKPRVKSNMLMTMIMLRWDAIKKELFMTGAGHEYLVIYKKEQQEVYKVKSGGMAIGMVKDISKTLKEMQIKFDPGDVIVLYSDGVTEAKNNLGLMFGIDRLMNTIKNTSIKTGQGIFNAITIELSKFMGYKHIQEDDVTLMVIYHKEPTRGQTVPAEIPQEFITEWNWSNKNSNNITQESSPQNVSLVQ